MQRTRMEVGCIRRLRKISAKYETARCGLQCTNKEVEAELFSQCKGFSSRSTQGLKYKRIATMTIKLVTC